MREPAAAMIFAAGLGTRMRHLTADRPKAMIQVAGRPLIDHALDVVAGTGADRVVVNSHHFPELLEAHLAARPEPIAISRETPDLLETGGGIRNARPLLGDGAIWTLNADAVWHGGDPARPLIDRWRNGPATCACLSVVARDRAIGHKGPGDFFMAPDGRLTRRGDAPTAPYVYTGLQIIDAGRVYDWPERIFSLGRVWDALIPEGLVHGAEFAGQWCDVGQPESIPLAEAMLAE